MGIVLIGAYSGCVHSVQYLVEAPLLQHLLRLCRRLLIPLSMVLHTGPVTTSWIADSQSQSPPIPYQMCSREIPDANTSAICPISVSESVGHA